MNHTHINILTDFLRLSTFVSSNKTIILVCSHNILVHSFCLSSLDFKFPTSTQIILVLYRILVLCFYWLLFKSFPTFFSSGNWHQLFLHIFPLLHFNFSLFLGLLLFRDCHFYSFASLSLLFLRLSSLCLFCIYLGEFLIWLFSSLIIHQLYPTLISYIGFVMSTIAFLISIIFLWLSFVLVFYW